MAACYPSSRCGLPLCSHHGQRSCLSLCRGDRRRKPWPGALAAPEEPSQGPWGHLGEAAGPGAGFLPVSPSDGSEGTKTGQVLRGEQAAPHGGPGDWGLQGPCLGVAEP